MVRLCSFVEMDANNNLIQMDPMHFETELEKGELFSRFIDLPQRLRDFSSLKRNPCQTTEA